MRCPQCLADEVHRSKCRSERERLLTTILPLSMYRCHNCNRRRMRFRTGKLPASTIRIIEYASVITAVLSVLAIIAFVVATVIGGGAPPHE